MGDLIFDEYRSAVVYSTTVKALEETLYDYEKRYMDLIASGTQGK